MPQAEIGLAFGEGRTGEAGNDWLLASDMKEQGPLFWGSSCAWQLNNENKI